MHAHTQIHTRARASHFAFFNCSQTFAGHLNTVRDTWLTNSSCTARSRLSGMDWQRTELLWILEGKHEEDTTTVGAHLVPTSFHGCTRDGHLSPRPQVRRPWRTAPHSRAQSGPPGWLAAVAARDLPPLIRSEWAPCSKSTPTTKSTRPHQKSAIKAR
jgi:hypothetical protein